MEKQILYRIIMSDSLPYIIGVAVMASALFAGMLKCMARAAVKRARRRRYLKSPLWKIDRMDGSEFEQYLAAYFESKGYKVTVTGGKGDYGADLIIKKDGIKTAVQAKRYKARVGVAAVQQAISAKEYYHTKYCMVATNSYFTKEAKKLARETGARLWDRSSLLKFMR